MARNLINHLDQAKVHKSLKDLRKGTQYVPYHEVRIEDPRLLDKNVKFKNAISRFSMPKVLNFSNKIILEAFLKWS